MRRFSEAERQTVWDMREAGVPVKRIARHLGRQPVSWRKFLSGTGGKRPSAQERSDLRLSLEECEEISRVWLPVTPFAPSLRILVDRLRRCAGRSAPTAGARNTGPWWPTRRLVGGPAAEEAKLAACRRLRGIVERKLEARWSPEQISAWLALEYPDRPEMHVSRETIYQSLRPEHSDGSWRELRRRGRRCREAPRRYPSRESHDP